MHTEGSSSTNVGPRGAVTTHLMIRVIRVAHKHEAVVKVTTRFQAASPLRYAGPG